MKLDNIYKLVAENCMSATFTKAEISTTSAQTPTPCGDQELCAFLTALGNDEAGAQLTVSNISWLQTEGLSGEELFPVVLTATKTETGKYNLVLVGRNREETYEYEVL